MNTERQPGTEATATEPEPTVTSVMRATHESFSLVPKSLTEAMQYAKLIAASDLCPKAYRGKAPDIVIAMEFGAHYGLAPMQALQSVAVINGMPTMWGDAVLAIVKQSPAFEWIDEREPKDALAAGEGKCTVKRKGEKDPVTRTFTIDDANRAGLIQRSKGDRGDGPWITYPGRMLQMRARSWALRDTFPDVLKGIGIREEMEDIKDVTPAPSVSMPRRASETTSDVDAFLQSQAAGSSGKAPASAGTWQGTITSREEKTAKKEGKERFYWAYRGTGETGETQLHTTDIKVDVALQPFVGKDVPVTIAGEFSMDTGWKITGVTLAQ